MPFINLNFEFSAPDLPGYHMLKIYPTCTFRSEETEQFAEALGPIQKMVL